jgi:hypothetical protein
MNNPLFSADGLVCLGIPRTDFFRLCSLFASSLNVRGCTAPSGAPLDPMQLLIALGGRESDYGADLKPRHEPSWDTGGYDWLHSLDLRAYIARYGPAGASSYGPLQVMAFDAGPNYTPAQLAKDPQTAMQAAVEYFNRYVIEHWRCTTLDQICRTWNGGHPTAQTTAGYCEFVEHAYATVQVAESAPAAPASEAATA